MLPPDKYRSGRQVVTCDVCGPLFAASKMKVVVVFAILCSVMACSSPAGGDMPKFGMHLAKSETGEKGASSSVKNENILKLLSVPVKSECVIDVTTVKRHEGRCVNGPQGQHQMCVALNSNLKDLFNSRCKKPIKEI